MGPFAKPRRAFTYRSLARLRLSKPLPLLNATPLGDPDYVIVRNESVVAHGLYG